MQRLGADVIGESPSARRPRAEWRDVGMARIERGERRNGLGGGKWGMRWRDSVGAGGGPDRAAAPSPPPDRSGIRQAVAPSPNSDASRARSRGGGAPIPGPAGS